MTQSSVFVHRANNLRQATVKLSRRMMSSGVCWAWCSRCGDWSPVRFGFFREGFSSGNGVGQRRARTKLCCRREVGIGADACCVSQAAVDRLGHMLSDASELRRNSSLAIVCWHGAWGSPIGINLGQPRSSRFGACSACRARWSNEGVKSGRVLGACRGGGLKALPGTA